jgi:hypothetical protein
MPLVGRSFPSAKGFLKGTLQGRENCWDGKIINYF